MQNGDLEASGRRRPHRKSKNGCQQCKKKKVKCDESKPSCGHCRRFHSKCSFLEALSPASSASDARATPSSSQPLYNLNNVSQHGRSNILEGSPPVIHHSFEVKDLELLHFYTTTTSLTVSNLPDRQHLWQQTIPQMAFTHQFLLHGLLAFSALHLAHVQPKRKALLYAEAAAHHDIGLGMFRTAMENITPKNCDACFAFSSILVAYAWASSNQTGDLFLSDPSVSGGKLSIEWITLLRGVMSLVETAGEWIATGPMKINLLPWSMDPEQARAADPEVSDRLTALSQLWDFAGQFNANDVETLNKTLDVLKQGYGLVMSSSINCQIDSRNLVFGWPITVPENFHVMVKELRPEALIVLAYYSLLLNKVDQVWYMQGMSRRLLQSIHSKIGKEWESWIAWPLQNLVLHEFQNQEECGKI